MGDMIIDDFKKLIENNEDKFTDDEYGLFSDSIRCFQSGIYRPAYIMAYQAVMIYFRRLILGAQKPTSFDQTKWDNIIRGLKDEKEWEKTLNNAIRKKNAPTATPPEVAVLDMPDELRVDFDFWRKRRNDSAHYKSYQINNSHVLAFYSFLNQYMMSISVEGGARSLLKEFKDACDETKTSQNESLQPYINKICSLVSKEEMNDFFDGLRIITYPKPFGRLDEIFENIVKGSDEQLKKYAIEYIRQNRKDEFINSNPWMVGHVVDIKEAREFWKKDLYFCKNRLAIIAQMLMLRMINSTEVEECLKDVIYTAFEKNEEEGDLEDEEKQELLKHGILKVLRSRYLNSVYTSRHAKECGKNHYHFFIGCLRLLPVDSDWVKTLIDMFEASDYPTVWLKILQERYLSDTGYKQKFHDVCNEHGITIPDWAK